MYSYLPEYFYYNVNSWYFVDAYLHILILENTKYVNGIYHSRIATFLYKIVPHRTLISLGKIWVYKLKFFFHYNFIYHTFAIVEYYTDNKLFIIYLVCLIPSINILFTKNKSFYKLLL